jgi:hypothetical protein
VHVLSITEINLVHGALADNPEWLESSLKLLEGTVMGAAVIGSIACFAGSAAGYGISNKDHIYITMLGAAIGGVLGFASAWDMLDMDVS